MLVQVNMLHIHQVRSMLYKLLNDNGAIRSHENPMLDSIKHAMKPMEMARYAVEKMHFKGSREEFCEALEYLTRDKVTLKGWHFFIGGSDYWNRWEWSIPPHAQRP